MRFRRRGEILADGTGWEWFPFHENHKKFRKRIYDGLWHNIDMELFVSLEMDLKRGFFWPQWKYV